MAKDDEDGDRKIIERWYASSFEVGHNAFQFKVDCGGERDGADTEGERMTVYLRVTSSPASARELFRLLGIALIRYSDAFGPIDGNGDREAGA